MCTAISFLSKDHYFGRNLDLSYHYQEQVAVAPRNFPLSGMESHPAIIGMATVAKGYPLFYEATNEYGLSAAALNFPGNGVYHKTFGDQTAIPSYDFISFVLSRCKSTKEARALLQNGVITDQAFCEGIPPTPLHWLVADRDEAIVAESMADGLHIGDNPVGVLTNNPPFDRMMDILTLYMGLSPEDGENCFAPSLPMTPFSRGLGAFGLPGDFSSPSRFVRSAYVLHHTPQGDERESVSRFFHILDIAMQPEGCVMDGGKFQKTLYSCCCNTDKGIYYYTTCHNRQITAVDMHKTDLDSRELSLFPPVTQMEIRWMN
ncbi:MAG: choloylglycine hydrolase family protein [Ruminococcaceae bacterium]|nr:choloylglycine hydrolase family protein [Oscillospiraceae bacterium]